ncbi:MAG: single-stranded-DNA-specific exonuclease RecJ [Clostridia bacterium]|nr:single-stranded-DNA-specific exonuclease RecJ [Clostridia bacterium]NCC43242.1 single-stranded-DNA-specific exonuclease RecJ [Clostridia bacterium]
MEKWLVAAKRADFKKIAETFGIDQVTARLIRNREVVGDEAIQVYLHGDRRNLYSPWLMKDMEKIVSILAEKIQEKKRIRVIGDYDVDGVMSTYILYQGLKGAGAEVDYVIPHRMTDGYGINEHLIEQAWEEKTDAIITCDNGIAASRQIERAKELGITVLVTDHHEVPFEENEGKRQEILPPADAIVNPKQADCNYPFTGLCGAGVALKVMDALYQQMQLEEDITDLMLEYAAIATIGDVMELVGENRIIVKEGLKKLHHTTNLGLQELIRVNGLEPEQISPYHIGFVVGPCLNATGRLDTAKRALKLLCAKNREEAAILAGDLKNLNDSRKEMTAQGVEKAIELVENSELINDKVLVVYLPECHESLAGIIAGRIRERYHKPAFVLTKAEEGVKGSGRSIDSYSMYEKLCECSQYLTKFGGHPMAAGLSLEEENVEPFRKKLNECSGLSEQDFIEKVMIDIPMPINYINKKLIQEMSVLEPFGRGNEKPVFAQKGLQIQNPRVFGKNRNVVKMRLADTAGYSMDAVYFGDGDQFLEEIKGKNDLSVVYYPEINSYQGRDTLQIIIRHYQ